MQLEFVLETSNISNIVYLVKLARDLTRPHPKWWFSKGSPLISGKSWEI